MLSRNNCNQYLDKFFKGIELKGKSVLDVGCGNGWISIYMAQRGAEVIGLEPKGYSGESHIFLHKGNVAILPCTLQSYEGIKNFDVIVLHDSINHLEEEACINLKNGRVSREIYYALFVKLYDMMNIGGKILIADASKSNFFPDFKLINPFDRTIEWHKHQTPELWVRLLRSCGFRHPEISWLTPKRLLFLDKVLSNRIASYFLVSHFRLIMEKP